jgi:dienelactone hydrolase
MIGFGGVDAPASPYAEEAFVKRSFLTSVAGLALATSSMLVSPTIGAGQTAPPMGGGYTDVIPIPVDDPTTKTIAGALFKPAGSGPFPGVIFMTGCAGLNSPEAKAMQKTVIDHLLAKGVATLLVDPFTPRNEPEGICANLNADTFLQYATRGGNDVVAALRVLKATPDIDPNRVFLQGYSWGAISSLFAADPKTPSAHDSKISGVIAYYPYCYDNVEFSSPTLVLIGDKDDWTPSKLCQAVKEKPNLKIVVFPGATHAFNMPFTGPIEYLGHHMAHDENATQEAQKDADAFMDSRLK